MNHNPKSIAFECLRLLSGFSVSPGHAAAKAKDVHRVVARLELASLEDPEKLEEIFRALLPYPENRELQGRLSSLAAEVCTSRDPRCAQCPLSEICPSSGLAQA